jgi:hypothetical protein
MGRMNRRLSLSVAILSAVCCAAPPLAATTLVRLSLTQLAGAANTVVRVRCLATASRWQNGAIWTFAEFERLETFKGAPPQRLRVQLPGGHVGHLIATVDSIPRFRPGEEGILFLEKTRAGTYAVTAWAEGTFRIRRNARTGAKTVTQDSSAFAVFDPHTRSFRTEGVRNLPLPEFRRRLASALARASSGTRATGAGPTGVPR